MAQRSNVCDERTENEARIRGMSENELWVFVCSGIFLQSAPQRLASKDVVLLGMTSASVEARVRVSSVDNVTVKYRTDGKDFPTIQLTGSIVRDFAGTPVSADGAVVLVPGNNLRYYESFGREVHNLHASYENCPTCNPGKGSAK